MKTSKLALGTVQFGLDYGINNPNGKVPQEEAHAILSKAAVAGVDTLDTASAYGESEKVIGSYLEGSRHQSTFNIISKIITSKADEVESSMERELSSLGIEKFYGYLIHHFDDYRQSPDLWSALSAQKAAGRVSKIGFSLYHPSELEFLFGNDVRVDLVQVPYSIFDQRFAPCLARAKQLGIEIHIRSVFLQGLVFKDPSSLERSFLKMKEKLQRLRALAEFTGASIASLCLSFAVAHEHIDKVVVGVDGVGHFEELLAAYQAHHAPETFRALAELKEDDESIILPYKWKK